MGWACCIGMNGDLVDPIDRIDRGDWLKLQTRKGAWAAKMLRCCNWEDR